MLLYHRSAPRAGGDGGCGEAARPGQRGVQLLFFFQAEDGIRDCKVTGVQTCALPIFTGAVVAVIGLNLAAIPVKNMAANNFESWMQALTFVCVGLVAVFTRGMVQRLLILVGLIAASLLYGLFTNVLGMGKPVDLSGVINAAWFGLPQFHGAAAVAVAARLDVELAARDKEIGRASCRERV